MTSLLERNDERRQRDGGRRLRDELRRRPGHRFVDPLEFKSLLASRHDLERADVVRAGLRGVRDRRSGVLYLIEAERIP